MGARREMLSAVVECYRRRRGDRRRVRSSTSCGDAIPGHLSHRMVVRFPFASDGNSVSVHLEGRPFRLRATE